MANRLHEGDLPEGYDAGAAVAIDTETMGLALGRDRLCVVQLSKGDGDADVVRIAPGQRAAPRLTAMLGDPKVLKLFHFGRFDMGVLTHAFGVMPAPIYCTKIASKLARTYTDRHGLKDLVKELLGVDLSKQQQSSDWGAATLSRSAARLRRLRRAASARAARQARRHAGARGPRRAREGGVRLSAGAGAARPCRVRGDGHFLARDAIGTRRGVPSPLAGEG